MLLVLLVTIVPIEFRPTTGSPNFERFVVMAVVGALFATVYPRRFWLIVLGLALETAGFELLQVLASGRHPAARDVGFKSAGAAIGAVLGYAASVVLAKAERLPETPPVARPEA